MSRLDSGSFSLGCDGKNWWAMGIEVLFIYAIALWGWMWNDYSSNSTLLFPRWGWQVCTKGPAVLIHRTSCMRHATTLNISTAGAQSNRNTAVIIGVLSNQTDAVLGWETPVLLKALLNSASANIVPVLCARKPCRTAIHKFTQHHHMFHFLRRINQE